MIERTTNPKRNIISITPVSSVVKVGTGKNVTGTAAKTRIVLNNGHQY